MLKTVPHNGEVSSHAVSAVVVAVSAVGAGLVVTASQRAPSWVAVSVAVVVVTLGVSVLSGPVRAMCAASLDDDGVAIAMPARWMLGICWAPAVVMAGLSVLAHPDRVAIPALVVLLAIPGVWCAAIDVATHRMPTRLIWTMLLSAAVGVFAAGWAEHSLGRSVQALMWGSVCGAVLLTVAVITAGTPGLADVRLVVVLGVLCGYLGAGHVWALTVFATMSAGLVAALQLGYRRFVRRLPGEGSLPFGPYLLAGAAAALIVG